MRIEIQPYNGTPIYRQISNQIRCLIASGQLKTEQERPVGRTLAEQLTVTPNTIVKAYDELGVAIMCGRSFYGLTGWRPVIG